MGLSWGMSLGFTFSNSLQAQIIPDETLGDERSIVTPTNINELESDRIEGGAQRGSSLFHSFQEFNIDAGRGAYFANPAAVENIFGRVTGNNISRLQGTLGVLGEANLFLLNPNGIIFGADAQLDLRGSFVGTTADSLVFPNGSQFSATNPQAPPILTVNATAPIGLEFADTPGNIVSEAELIVDPGKTLAFIGGDIAIENGGIIAEGGKIELGSVANGSVEIDTTEPNLAFDYQQVNSFLDINLINTAFIDSSGEPAGDINIQARNFTVSDDAGIFATTFGAEDGGIVSINAANSVEFNGFVGLFSTTEGQGAAPSIAIDTKNLVVSGGASIASDVCFEAGNCAEGDGGDLQVVATESVELDGLGLFTSTEASGDAGDITVETQQLTVSNGANIFSSSAIESDGRAGNITVDASESVDLIGVLDTGDGLFPSGIFSQANAGRGGNITINTTTLIARDGAIIDASTFGTGDAGNLTVTASDSIELIGTAGEADLLSGLFAQVTIFAPENAGDAGNLTIETGELILRDGAQIANTARLGGNGGELNINATNFILLEGTAPDATPLRGSSGIFASADPVENDSGELITPVGNAGELNISTSQLTVEDGAKISADNFGTGTGGNATLNLDRLIISDGGLIRAGSFDEGAGGKLTVDATESITVTGTGNIGDTPVNSTLFTGAEGQGNAGDLTVNTPNLTVSGGGEISASTLDAGQGGNIVLEVAEQITLTGDGSGLFANTETNSTGQGGNIVTQGQTPQTITIQDGAAIAVNSDGSGQGGNTNLTTEELVLDNGAITAETASNTGGNINLEVPDLLTLRRGSQITTTAGTAEAGGDGGNIAIDSELILAVPQENNDITANAFTGDGGRVEIDTSGLFGIEPRENLTPLSDITASSELGTAGIVEINSPDIDPNRGLNALPETTEDVEIASGCQAINEAETVSFFDLGRGGIIIGPRDALSSETIITPWIPLLNEKSDHSESTRSLGNPELLSSQEIRITRLCQRD